MNAKKIIKELKQESNMWLGPNYTSQEEWIYKFIIKDVINDLISRPTPYLKDYFDYVVPLLSSIRDRVISDKAPRTGFKKPTKKEIEEVKRIMKEIDDRERHEEKLKGAEKLKREFWVMKNGHILNKVKRQKGVITLPQSDFHCHIHKKTPLTRVRSIHSFCSECRRLAELMK